MRAVPAGKYDPCIDNKVEQYFNRPDVQRAFHANSSEHTLPWAWKGCSDYVNYSRSGQNYSLFCHGFLLLSNVFE